ncbi:MAG: DMT family transporter [Sphingomicrobium sp.]
MTAHQRATFTGVVLPFIIFTTIWGSTWFVIRSQIGTVAPQWSVAYRFIIAAAAMALLARLRGQPLRPSPGLFGAALVLGISQFSVNFNSVYIAEQFITSGVVATVFAILLVPNSLLAWAWLGQRPDRRFAVGGAIAAFGATLLFAHELGASRATSAQVLAGLGFTLVGLLGASVANVYQARPKLLHLPLFSLLAWSMAIGALIDVALALLVAGPPTFDWQPAYWLGLIYLALAASVLCFSLYFPVVRKIGPGRAAYSSVLVPIIAMSLSTLFEGYRWSLLAATGATLTLVGMLIAVARGRRARPEPIAAPDAA